MCPICISVVAAVVAGTGSTGGLAALVVSRLHAGPRPASDARIPRIDLKTGMSLKTTETTDEN